MENVKKMYVTAEEAAEMLGISTGYAYKIIFRGLNEELKEKGLGIPSGKVPTKYFKEIPCAVDCDDVRVYCMQRKEACIYIGNKGWKDVALPVLL